jgi:hypothetical protein
MRATECQEKGTPKRLWKMRFISQMVMDGVSKLAVVMPGVEFTVQTTTKIVVVGNSVLQAYGAQQLTLPIMAGRFGGLSTTALPGKLGRLRLAA